MIKNNDGFSSHIVKLNKSALPLLRNRLELPHRLLNFKTAQCLFLYMLFAFCILFVIFTLEILFKYYAVSGRRNKLSLELFNKIEPRFAASNVNFSFDLILLKNERIKDLSDELAPLNGEQASSFNETPFDATFGEIKRTLIDSFLAANKRIEFCSPYGNNLTGPLNVTSILDDMEMTNLVQFHEPSTFNLSNNNYNDNNLYFLNETIFRFKVRDAHYRQFWHMWHTSNVSEFDWPIMSNVNVTLGGKWQPQTCLSRFKVAIIIPFRDRIPHLKVLTNYLHFILQRQLISYRIFVVEPTTPLNIKFNKGRVMNAGYLEALRIDSTFNCIIFHDVDLLPEDDRNIYSCSQRPKHLSVLIDKFNYRLPYDYLVGGVFSIKTNQYRTINGYSNSYWGWGGEDDDFSTRIKSTYMHIDRPPANIARFRMMRHKLQELNENRHNLLKHSRKNQALDGLNSVTYEVIAKKLYPGFTYFLINVGLPLKKT